MITYFYSGFFQSVNKPIYFNGLLESDEVINKNNFQSSINTICAAFREKKQLPLTIEQIAQHIILTTLNKL